MVVEEQRCVLKTVDGYGASFSMYVKKTITNTHGTLINSPSIIPLYVLRATESTSSDLQ